MKLSREDARLFLRSKLLRYSGEPLESDVDAVIALVESNQNLPGWTCNVLGCGVFNGEAKERRFSCRNCDAPHPCHLGTRAIKSSK